MRPSCICLLLGTLVAATIGLEAQAGLPLTVPVKTMTGGGTTTLSPSVMGSYYFTRGDAAMSRLEALHDTVRVTTTGRDGRYTLEVPPGQYWVAALDGGQPLSEEVLTRLQSTSTQIFASETRAVQADLPVVRLPQ